MTTTPAFEKSIRYDRETRDFRATLDDNLIGYFATYHDAEVALDQVAYDQLMDGIALQARCANCDGPHSIQQCPEILAALFAPQRPAKRLALVAALAILAFVLLACAGDATCSPRNDGSRAAATCVTQ